MILSCLTQLDVHISGLECRAKVVKSLHRQRGQRGLSFQTRWNIEYLGYWSYCYRASLLNYCDWQKGKIHAVSILIWWPIAINSRVSSNCIFKYNPYILNDMLRWVEIFYPWNMTLFLMIPIFSISTITTSPCFKKLGGVKKAPTPLGVPVIMMVPTRIVRPLAKNLMISLTSKTKSLVLACCLCSLFTLTVSCSCPGCCTTLVDTMKGPIGPNPSNDFAYPAW